jgi:catechol-2,3-dioxygenase
MTRMANKFGVMYVMSVSLKDDIMRRRRICAMLMSAMIIDHIGLAVSDYGRSLQFFKKALAPLGIELVMEVEGWAAAANRSSGSDYAAFVIGPDGHNIEAVSHTPGE